MSFVFDFKQALERYAPKAAAFYNSTQLRREFKRKLLARQTRYKSLIYGDADPKILSGPFAGMKYLNEIVWGPIECKWLGTYEQELTPALNSIFESNYTTVIDVGSAEGYYAVGLAYRMPKAKVYSYDSDLWARWQQRRLANLNGVKNLSIRGFCSSAELDRLSSAQTLIVCDIEGFEYDLLDPAKTKGLLQCDILVEVHEWNPGDYTMESGTNALIERFQSSHDVQVIRMSPRDASSMDGAAPDRLSPTEFVDCMDEMRWMAQVWLWLRSRAAKIRPQ